jgi:hypothetical protein
MNWYVPAFDCFFFDSKTISSRYYIYRDCHVLAIKYKDGIMMAADNLGAQSLRGTLCGRRGYFSFYNAAPPRRSSLWTQTDVHDHHTHTFSI